MAMKNSAVAVDCMVVGVDLVVVSTLVSVLLVGSNGPQLQATRPSLHVHAAVFFSEPTGVA